MGKKTKTIRKNTRKPSRKMNKKTIKNTNRKYGKKGGVLPVAFKANPVSSNFIPAAVYKPNIPNYSPNPLVTVYGEKTPPSVLAKYMNPKKPSSKRFIFFSPKHSIDIAHANVTPPPPKEPGTGKLTITYDDDKNNDNNNNNDDDTINELKRNVFEEILSAEQAARDNKTDFDEEIDKMQLKMINNKKLHKNNKTQ